MHQLFAMGKIVQINYLNQKKAFEDNVTLDYLERILEILNNSNGIGIEVEL